MNAWITNKQLISNLQKLSIFFSLSKKDASLGLFLRFHLPFTSPLTSYFCAFLVIFPFLPIFHPAAGQPEELTNVLEICNIVFTSMFSLEMILKLTAFGSFNYLRNPYNVFDGIIVIIRYNHC